MRDLCGFVATAGPGQISTPAGSSWGYAGVLALTVSLGMASRFPLKGGCSQPGTERAHGDREPSRAPKDTRMGSTATASFRQALWVKSIRKEPWKFIPVSQLPLPTVPEPEEQWKPQQFSPSTPLQAGRKDSFRLWLLLNLHKVQCVPTFFPALKCTQTTQQDVLTCPSVPLPALSIPRFCGTPAEAQVVEEDDGAWVPMGKVSS